MQTLSSKYNLFSTERVYRHETLLSYYFQSNKKVVKKFKPVDLDGERYRLNLETGELGCYKLSDIYNSKAASVRRSVIHMNMLLEMNDFFWFWTLTFDNERVDRTNDEVVLRCYTKYINNLKKKVPSVRYMCFPERHEDGCIHFHLLVGGITPTQMGLVNSGKVCCSWATHKNGVASKEYFEKTKSEHLHELKDTDGETIFNVTSFAYGYTTASRIVSRERCNSYVKKYVEKALGSTSVFKKRFYYSENLNVPDVVKRLIGADFKNPKKINEVSFIRNNPYFKNSLGAPYLTEHNVLQIKLDNEIKRIIDLGIEPINNISEKEKFAVSRLFDAQQKFNI